MKLGNFAFELADKRAAQERDAGIEAAQAELRKLGTPSCVGCGEEIEPERRRALPSARRCHECQERLERLGKRRRG